MFNYDGLNQKLKDKGYTKKDLKALTGLSSRTRRKSVKVRSFPKKRYSVLLIA